jgi:predicted CXXCH cytochrome family protein
MTRSIKLLPVFALFALAAVLAPALRAASPALPPAAILYPSSSCVITSDLVLVIAIASSKRPAPTLALDGKPLPTRTMSFDRPWIARGHRLFPTTRPNRADPAIAELLKDKSDKQLILATAPLSPGQHTLALDGAQAPVQIFRSTSAAPSTADAPAGRPVFHTHGPVNDAAKALACTECHEANDDDPAGRLGLAKTPTACQTCHTDVDIQLIHRHVTDPLSRCQTCHDPHGTTRPKLLVDAPEKLCTMCHEGGHSKR